MVTELGHQVVHFVVVNRGDDLLCFIQYKYCFVVTTFHFIPEHS